MALVPSALGVDWATILRDYAATYLYWQTSREQMLQRLARAGQSTEALRPLLAANLAYLDRTFAAIDKQYGSVDDYLATVMDLTPQKLAALRAKYLN